MKTLLLISAYFPPSPAVGGMRAAAFTRRLPSAGWQTCVVTLRGRGRHVGTPDVGAYRVERTRGAHARELFAIAGRYPALLALPDGYAPWFPFALARSLRVIREQRPAVLMTTGPPSTAHCIGLAVRRLTNLPWAADLRDPWRTTTIGGRFYQAVDCRLERAVMSSADRIITTTDGIAGDLLRRLGPHLGDKVSVISNGYDEEVFGPVVPPPVRAGFTLAHVGSITGYRDARPFLRAVRDALATGSLPADTRVEFFGGGDASACTALQRATENLQLQRHVVFTPHSDVGAAVQAMHRASVLLLLQSGPEVAFCIPTKAFEYLQSGRPILCLAPDGSEVRRLTSGFAGVFAATPDDVVAMRTQLEAAYRAAQSGGAVRRDVAAYSRQAAARQLAVILDTLASGERRAPA